MVPFDQSGIDFFRAHILESRINQRPCRQGKTICDQQRVDRQVCRFIPEARITLAATAVVPKGAVQDLVSKHSFKFSWPKRIGEGGTVNDVPAVGGHRWYGAWDELQTETQRPKEWLVQ